MPVSPQTHMPKVSGALFICRVPPAHLAVVGAETLPSASSGAKEPLRSSDQRSGEAQNPVRRVAGRELWKEWSQQAFLRSCPEAEK